MIAFYLVTRSSEIEFMSDRVRRPGTASAPVWFRFNPATIPGALPTPPRRSHGRHVEPKHEKSAELEYKLVRTKIHINKYLLGSTMIFELPSCLVSAGHILRFWFTTREKDFWGKELLYHVRTGDRNHNKWISITCAQRKCISELASENLTIRVTRYTQVTLWPHFHEPLMEVNSYITSFPSLIG